MKKYQLFILYFTLFLTGCTKDFEKVNFPTIGKVNVSDLENRNLSLSCFFNGDFDKLNYNLERTGFCYSITNKIPTVEDQIIVGTVNQDGTQFTGAQQNLPHSKKIHIRGFIDIGQEIFYSPVYEQAAFPAGEINFKELTSFPSKRTEAVAFSIGNKGYIGTGSFQNDACPLDDFWEYNPETDEWSQIANFPRKTSSAFSFVIGDKAYVGGGSEVASSFGSLAVNDFAAYDPTTNTWEQMAAIPVATAGAIGFSIEGKGYVIGGIIDSNRPALDIIQVYDPILNKWERTIPAPFQLTGVAGVVHKDIAYIGPSFTSPNTFSAYIPQNYSWTDLPSIPDNGGGDFLSFIHDNKIYIGFGMDASPNQIRDNIWQYDIQNKEWGYFSKAVSNAFDPNFSEGITFTIDNRVFVGIGQNRSGYTDQFFEIIFD